MITASADCTVRVWAADGQYVGMYSGCIQIIVDGCLGTNIAKLAKEQPYFARF